MDIKKALIVKKPWLDKIFDEGKVWEMRTTRTKITGKIGLIESGTGLIVGEAELIGCSENPVSKSEDLIKYHKVEDLDLLDKWKWAWILCEAKRYANPIPYEHPQGAVIWVNIESSNQN
jgi:hypothetical protein